jgi:hypothetical protein
MTKKLIAGIVFASMIVPALAFGATTNQSTLASELQSLIKQAIALLMQEVAELQAQLVTGNTDQNSSSTPAVACTMDAKLCPDGSYVGRSGPLCALAACPASTVTSTVSAATPSSSVSATFIPSGISAVTIAQVSKMPLTKIGTITIGASSAGPIQLASLKLTFSGNGYAAGSSTFLNTVLLKDPNAVDVASSFGATKIEDTSAGTVAWTFPTTAASAPVVSAGKSLTFQLWAETDVIPPVSETADALPIL